MLNKIGREIPKNIKGVEGREVFEGAFAVEPKGRLRGREIAEVKPGETKLLSSIEEAIKKTGLKDGMTISFHHHFREGDYVLNKVMDVIASMGIKNLNLAPSS
ncbi:MAG: citrate lyase subunit alpha, partial [Clostridium sp.]|uniref:citrate lyase subunit alpha n=1 Tax=Clostridium sp. TaxID=1506 RepID=UPI003EE7F62F